MSPDKVAAMFGVTRRTVDRWFDAGLEAVKMRGRKFTTLAAIDRFAVHSTAPVISARIANAEHEAAERDLERLGII